jgi:outer membrane protein assembly factor BamB
MKQFALPVLVALCWLASAADVVELARSSGVQGGLVVHLNCGDGTQTLKLRLNEKYLVHGLDVSDGNVQTARKNILAAKLYGPVSASVFDGARLPYVDNLVNLIVCDGGTKVPREELLRALAPLGVALVDGQKLVKPWPAEIDEWTHYLHGPDNNAVAKDSVVATPRSIQWVAEPRWGRSHEELASMSAAVTAQGRLFYIEDEAPLASIRYLGQWKLVARDAFNGVLLWKKDIPCWTDHLRHFRAGPLHLPRRLVAAGDRVYVTLGLGAPVTALDAATGQEVRVYKETEHTEEILCDNGVLYLAVGNSEIQRRGEGLFTRNEPEAVTSRTLVALDAADGTVRWKKPFEKDEFLLPQTLAVSGPNVFYQSSAGVVRLDARTGKELWRTPRATPARRMAFSAPTLVVAGDVVLLADRDAGDKTAAGGIEWGVHGWDEPGFDRKGKCALRAYAVDNGKELWSAPCSEGYNSPVDLFVVKDTVWVGADFKGHELKTGREVRKLDWKGDPVGMAHHRCYRNKATEDYILTGRSGVEMVSLDRATTVGCAARASTASCRRTD